MSRDATSSAFRRERAPGEREERETDGTTFPHVFFPVERKNFQTTGNAGARLACGIVGKVKNNRSCSLSFLFFSFLFFSSKNTFRIVEAERLTEKPRLAFVAQGA